MYAFVDFLVWASCLSSFIYLVKASPTWHLSLPLCSYLLAPLLLEPLYNLLSSCQQPKQLKLPRNHDPIVYSSQYNLTLCYVERLHPFDSEKYRHVYQILLSRRMVSLERTIRPNRVGRSMLLTKVSPGLLIKICYSIMITSYVEMPLFVFPSWLLRWRVLNPMLAATEGTLWAAEIAMKNKCYGINLSGGFHHANIKYGGGFCIYPDITICVEYVRKFHNIRRVMVIDLDAHQGNGHQRDLKGDKEAYVLDVYNRYIYPGDSFARQAISRQVCVSGNQSDQQYLQLVEDALNQSISEFKPEFIIYNAGTDIMEGDPLGRMRITGQGIIDRDELVFTRALSAHVPLCMVLSGGYQRTNAQVIAASIENILKKFPIQD